MTEKRQLKKNQSILRTYLLCFQTHDLQKSQVYIPIQCIFLNLRYTFLFNAYSYTLRMGCNTEKSNKFLQSIGLAMQSISLFKYLSLGWRIRNTRILYQYN